LFKRLIKRLPTGMLYLLLGACSTFPMSAPTSAPNTLAYSHFGADMSDAPQITEQLLSQHTEWKGVPHKFGGLSKNGIDCSGFLHLIFAQEFGIEIPRTTQYQMQQGVVVNQDELIPGDLIFFITGFDQRHVGVYMGDNQFMHTSSSRGVMISKLSNPYWSKVYWHARRVAL
jgi:cell wall-associated NlpC family hydrolase